MKTTIIGTTIATIFRRCLLLLLQSDESNNTLKAGSKTTKLLRKIKRRGETKKFLPFEI
jgi:hypothetical protein